MPEVIVAKSFNNEDVWKSGWNTVDAFSQLDKQIACVYTANKSYFLTFDNKGKAKCSLQQEGKRQ